jgi:hypothetical protein
MSSSPGIVLCIDLIQERASHALRSGLVARPPWRRQRCPTSIGRHARPPATSRSCAPCTPTPSRCCPDAFLDGSDDLVGLRAREHRLTEFVRRVERVLPGPWCGGVQGRHLGAGEARRAPGSGPVRNTRGSIWDLLYSPLIPHIGRPICPISRRREIGVCRAFALCGSLCCL